MVSQDMKGTEKKSELKEKIETILLPIHISPREKIKA